MTLRRLLPALLCAMAPLLAQQSPNRGPAVGAPVPAFSAVDQFGKQRDLKSLQGPKGTWLLFFRSADW